MRDRTSASQACGSTPFILAVTMRLYMAAARCPPRSDPQNSHDFLPRAMPRSPLSAATHATVFKEQSKVRPSLQDVIERFGQVVSTGEFGKLFPHVGVKILDQRPAQRLPNGQALFGALAIDRSLELKQHVDPTYELDGDWRQRDFLLAAALRRAFSSISAMAKNGRRACAQQAASRIGPGFRPAR